MANQPALNATVKITCKDINNNSVAKQFNAVKSLNIDYFRGDISVIDVTGSFHFPILPLATVTYTVTPGVNGVHVIVMS